MCMYICMLMCTVNAINVYDYELLNTSVNIYIYKYKYTYIQREREGEGERETARRWRLTR